MPSLEDLEELRRSLEEIVARAEILRLPDLVYLLRMAKLEIADKQQAEMDRLEADNSFQSIVEANVTYQRAPMNAAKTK